MSRLRPWSRSLRDQVTAILRDAEEPMTVREIGALVPFSCPDRVCRCAEQGRRCVAWTDTRTDFLGRPEYREHIPGQGTARFTRGSCGADLSRPLAAMAKAGEVEMIKVGRRARWRWIGHSPDMSAFEAALASVE